MKSSKQLDTRYLGFEQGPIRPPSEAHSLLIRVTRNCPWNRCTFCPLYKQSSFSIRPIDHVKKDVDKIYQNIQTIKTNQIDQHNSIIFDSNYVAYAAAKRWYDHNMESIFLQDSNSLVINPNDLIDLLHHIKNRFPTVKRITSYARSSTIHNLALDTLGAFQKAGLNRIHIGLESGSNDILRYVCKGATKELHIDAGKKVKATGIELSEYVMPGLGGQFQSTIHATETADAINQINPDFIRLRPLALPHQIANNSPFSLPEFKKCTDQQIVQELHQFISQLEGITSTLLSDHILNLFTDLQGTFPEEKDKMLALLDNFLNLPIDQQYLYQLGRRMGIFSTLKDLNNQKLTTQVKLYEHQIKKMNISIDHITDELMQRFI
ncbi:MAG: radical SAM protein [Candidatus Thermoplasmatota archaeon]|nr:radical SAM protein [Candidatus Thermoplasmatota archaeon]MBU1941202.1 radical SAM protein [Candidatus Thermoplasmatota archaeon]